MKRRLLLLATALILVGALPAKIITQPVAYTHSGVALEGWLAYDDSVTALRPGVLVVPEWWGVNDYAKGRARQFVLEYLNGTIIFTQVSDEEMLAVITGVRSPPGHLVHILPKITTRINSVI